MDTDDESARQTKLQRHRGLLKDLNAVLPADLFPMSRRRNEVAGVEGFGSERLIFQLRRYCSTVCEVIVPEAGPLAFRTLVRSQAAGLASIAGREHHALLYGLRSSSLDCQR